MRASAANFDEHGFSELIRAVEELELGLNGGTNDLNNGAQAFNQVSEGSPVYALASDVTADLAALEASFDASIAALGTMSTQNASAVAITGGSITGITDLAVADGGTGASDAATARTNFGLGTIATQAASGVAVTGGSITGITDLAIADGGTASSDLISVARNLGLISYSFNTAGTRYVTGSGTHTFNAATKTFCAVLVAGGGGGASGSAGSGADSQGGSGGGAGEMVVLFGLANGGSGLSYVVGAGGATGGGNGTASSLDTVGADFGRGGATTIGGAAGGALSDGYAGTAQSASRLVLRFPGENGREAFVQRILTVSSYTARGGRGGSPRIKSAGVTNYGGGGEGGPHGGGASVAGDGGAIWIWEK